MEYEKKTAVVEGELISFANGFMVINTADEQGAPLYHLSTGVDLEEVKRLIHHQVRVQLKNDQYGHAPYRIVRIEELPQIDEIVEVSIWRKIINHLF